MSKKQKIEAAKKAFAEQEALRLQNLENAKTERLSEDDCTFVQMDEKLHDQKFEHEPISFYKDAWLRFKQNKASIVAAAIILVIVLMAIFAPVFSGTSYREQHTEFGVLPPRIPYLENLGIADGCRTMEIQKSVLDTYGDAVVEVIHEYNQYYRGKPIPMVEAKVNQYILKGADDYYFFFGTDNLGRDLWVRLWRGTRISLIIGVCSVLINCFIGVVYGAVSGYYGGKVDMLMQRIIEILGGVPFLVMAILFVMFLGAGIRSFILVLIITGWIGMSRMIRAQFFRYKDYEYVLASRTMGASDRRLIFRHILPNAIGPIITQATFAVPSAIFSESFLSYLGLGIQAPEPSIGVLLAEGQGSLTTSPHLTLFPAIVVSLLMLSFNLFGNGLRDAFDPRARGSE